MFKVVTTFAVIATLAVPAWGQTRLIEHTADYAAGPGEAEEDAMRIARLDAYGRVLDDALIRLQGAAETRVLTLTEDQLRAYAIGAVEVTNVTARTTQAPAGRSIRVTLRATLDPGTLARRFGTLRFDAESSSDLLGLSRQIQGEREEVTEKRRALPRATPANRPAAVAALHDVARKLDVDILLAQASYRLAKLDSDTGASLISTPDSRIRARVLVEQALTILPDDVDGHGKLGDLLWSEGKFADAAHEFQLVVTARATSARARNRLGNALLSQNRRDESIAALRGAVLLDANDAIIHNDLGVSLMTPETVIEAIAEFREAIRLAPDYASPYNNLGIAFSRTGDMPEALKAFREVIRLRPDWALGHYNASIALAEMEDDAACIAELRETIRINPNHFNAHYNLGEILRLQGDIEESAKAFGEFVHLAQNIPAEQRKVERAKTFIEAFK